MGLYRQCFDFFHNGYAGISNKRRGSGLAEFFALIKKKTAALERECSQGGRRDKGTYQAAGTKTVKGLNGSNASRTGSLRPARSGTGDNQQQPGPYSHRQLTGYRVATPKNGP